MGAMETRNEERRVILKVYVAAVGSPPAADNPAADVYTFAIAAPSPLIQAGFITLGALKKLPPQLAGITAGCLSTRPAPPLAPAVAVKLLHNRNVPVWSNLGRRPGRPELRFRSTRRFGA
jgi:hypothetical protein